MSTSIVVATNKSISKQQANGLVSTALTNTRKGRDSVHLALMGGIQYAWENQGAGLDGIVCRLFQGMFDQDCKQYHEQMKAWVEEFFPIKVLFDKDKQRYTVKLSKKWDNLTDDDWKFNEAKELPYFKLDSKSAADAKPIGFDSLLLMLKRVATIEQQDKRPIVDKDKALVHDLSTKVQLLLDTYQQKAA